METFIIALIVLGSVIVTLAILWLLLAPVVDIALSRRAQAKATSKVVPVRR